MRTEIEEKAKSSREQGAAAGSKIREALSKGLLIEGLILVAYLVLQVNGLCNHGYVGQDYVIHYAWTQEAKADPIKFLTQYSVTSGMGRTNPPLYHLAAAFAARYGPFASEARNIGLLNVLTGAAGVWLLMATARAWIKSLAVRMVFALFISFTPVFVVHNLVTASDVLTMPAIGMILLGLTRILQEPQTKTLQGTALVFAGVFCGILTKFTFAAVPGAIGIFLAAAWWIGKLTQRQAILSGMAAAFLPGILFGLTWLFFHRTVENHFNREGYSNHFTIVDLLLLKPADAELLNAPPYSQQIDPKTGHLETAPFPDRNSNDLEYPLCITFPHRHSYQPLLIDALFTDIMDLRQPGRIGKYFGPRSEEHQRRMEWAVRCGLMLYLGSLVATVFACCGAVQEFWRGRRATALFTLTCFLLSSLMAGPVLAGMLFVKDAYLGGYWLPRLIMPSIACVILALCIWLDGLEADWRGRDGIALVGIALSQVALYVSFLWI